MLFNFKPPVLPVSLLRTTRHGVPGIWDVPWASLKRREKRERKRILTSWEECWWREPYSSLWGSAFGPASWVVPVGCVAIPVRAHAFARAVRRATYTFPMALGFRSPAPRRARLAQGAPMQSGGLLTSSSPRHVSDTSLVSSDSWRYNTLFKGLLEAPLTRPEVKGRHTSHLSREM